MIAQNPPIPGVIEGTLRSQSVKIWRLISLLVLMALLLPLSRAAGDVPHPGLLEKIEKGEVEIPYYLKNLVQLRGQGVNAPGILPDGSNPYGPENLPDVNFNAIAILVDFSDNVGQVSGTFFDNLLFGTGTGTVRHYYDEVTYGNLTVVTVNLPSTLGWQRAPQTYTYYANNSNGLGSYPQNAQKLTEDAVALANPFIDFSQYDNNNDGYVDALFIIHAGPGAEFTGNNNHIWSHKWATRTPQLVDGVYVYTYSMEPEYWQNPGDMTCGVYAHEMGHSVFGLPDVYDRDGSSRGLGRWSLMAGGSWNGTLGNSPAHPDAYNRVRMGYVTPANILQDTTGYSLPNIQNNPSMVRLWRQGNSGGQYFLVENRQRVGYDAALPAAGLCIYHVDEGVTTQNDREWYPGYTSNGHYLVALEQADGLWSMERNQNSGNNGDPFPGSTNNRVFDANSTPDSRDYNSNSTLVAVRNISSSGMVMSADFEVGVVPLYPDIEVSPLSFTFNLTTGDTASGILTIANTGNANLQWSISESPVTGWVTENPLSGTVTPGSNQISRISVNSGSLATGSYYCDLLVASNDPDENPVVVPCTLTVSASPVNLPPVAVNDSGRVAEDQSVQLNLLANDYDPDGSLDPASLAVHNAPVHGSVSVNPVSGLVTYQPDSDYFGSDQLTYTVDDNQGATSNLATVLIEVTPVNDPPVLAGIPDIQFAEDGQYSLSLDSYVTDVDHSPAAIEFSARVLSAGGLPVMPFLRFPRVGINDLFITIDPVTHVATFTCSKDSSGLFTVLFTAIDDSGASDTDTMMVTVYPMNDPPQITGLPDSLVIARDSSAVLAVWEYVSDVESPDSLLSYHFAQQPVLLDLQFNDRSGELRMTPLPGMGGISMLRITVTDDSNAVASDSLVLVIDVPTGKGISAVIIPRNYFLDQNYPNPFNPTTRIEFQIPENTFVTLKIYNLLGEEVAILFSGEMPPGFHRVEFDASQLSSGMYFYRLQAGDFTAIRKMILSR